VDNHKKLYDSLYSWLKSEIPGFEVRYKNESRMQRLWGWFWSKTKLNPYYMVSTTTTVRPYVYSPNKKFVTRNYARSTRILAHEAVHLFDQKNKLFYLKYTSPQILAILVLGALGSIWCWWAMLCLLSLICLAPWRSKGRTKYELRGYGVGMAIDYWTTGAVLQSTKDNVLSALRGWSYYKMWSNPESSQNLVDDLVRRVESEEVLQGIEGTVYRKVKQILADNHLLHTSIDA
jgi:hypothetical protein